MRDETDDERSPSMETQQELASDEIKRYATDDTALAQARAEAVQAARKMREKQASELLTSAGALLRSGMGDEASKRVLAACALLGLEPGRRSSAPEQSW